MISSKKSRFNVHFPTKEEMHNQIWNKEYHRTPPKNNQSQPINYTFLIKLLEYYEVQADFLLKQASADLIMDETNKLIKILIEKINNKVIAFGLKFGVKIHPEYQGLIISKEDNTLVRKIIEEGNHEELMKKKGLFPV